eukprot:Gb_28152 [translate_table: standard]
MVDEWRVTLQEVSNISGLSHSDLKGRLPRAVVQEVLKKIKSEPLIGAKFLVGLEEPEAQLREYIRKCRMEKNHVALVGIIGIAGIGNSTLAKSLFDNIRWDLNFKKASYIEDIKGEAEKKGLQEVQRKLLHSLLHYDYQVLSQSQSQQIISKRLRSIDALIVLDNIKDKEQLDAILSSEVLLPSSTVIVTSRDYESIFKRCNNFLKYEMPRLNSSQSKKLFCRHAFDSGVACAPFENLVDEFVGICEGVPLALEVCGRELEEGGVVRMHDALRDLGRTIVDEESPTNPGGCSPLWRPNDVKKVIESSKRQWKQGTNRQTRLYPNQDAPTRRGKTCQERKKFKQQGECRVVHPLRLCLAPLWLCLTAADDSSAIDVDPPRLPSDDVAQTSLSTQNDFDVFINHRGVDVKDSLASHIYDLLQSRGVRAFLDREELRTGEEFPDAITEAIKSSLVHIAIFSPHYAESDWCLRELALMLKTPNATIIPVFYNVTPGELRWAKGAFAKAFGKHYRRYSREMVDEWSAALHEVSNISGLFHSDLKGRLPRAVLQKVMEKIKSEPLIGAQFLVGLEQPVAQLSEYIRKCRMEKNHVALVGIVGMAGIGKSTLAKFLFDNITSHFEKASYIEDIKGEVEKKGLIEVQRKLLHSLRHYDFQVESQRRGKQIIRNRLCSIDALIVLDNIEDKEQLDAILSPEILLPGSTVIVTSRDYESIFKRCPNFLRYEMLGLNSSQSRTLFCQHAFYTGVACAPFENLVDKFVGICKGVPLALEVCGRELESQSYDFWESFLQKITETNLTCNFDTLKSILQESYTRLEEKQKQIFLDIAIFFSGENVDTIERIWSEDSKNSFKHDLRKLESKCMIKSEGGVVRMHDAFRDLGRTIVDQESPTNPGDRSRLWRPNDVKKVLESSKVPQSHNGVTHSATLD